MKTIKWKGVNEMSDKSVMLWLVGFFLVALIGGVWLSGQPYVEGPECENVQYSANSC